MTFHGKAIYQPEGKAGEYSQWAANFYNGCSAKCDYCYNRNGRAAKILGGDIPTLKKSLIDEDNAFEIFRKEIHLNFEYLQKHGLFFNFVSDPFLPETIELNVKAMYFCELWDIPVKVLTKQTWWIDRLFNQGIKSFGIPKNVAVGFTLTGYDELEPGAATNMERIEAIKKLHKAGLKTWASFEPIIDLDTTYKMILLTLRHDCIDLYKIGLQSGKKYDKSKLLTFLSNCLIMLGDKKVYFKDSLLKQLGISRDGLPENCVSRDFNL